MGEGWHDARCGGRALIEGRFSSASRDCRRENRHTPTPQTISIVW